MFDVGLVVVGADIIAGHAVGKCSQAAEFKTVIKDIAVSHRAWTRNWHADGSWIVSDHLPTL